MHKRTKKDNLSTEDKGQKQNLRYRNRSNEKKSAAGATEKIINRETKDERNIKENRHHKTKTDEKPKKHGISEGQTPKSKKSERGHVDLKESLEKPKKTKHKDRSFTRESVFTNIENYLKSLSRAPQIQYRRSRSSEQYDVKHKNKHDLRREKTIHVVRTKDNAMKMQQKRERKHTSQSKGDKRPKRNDSGNGQLFYCQVETHSPFQPSAAQEESPPARHSKRHKERKSSPVHDELHSKDIPRKKLKEDNSETNNMENLKVNIHKRKKSRANIVDESKISPIPMVESNIECKRRRSHKKRSSEIKSRSKRKKSFGENDDKVVSHSSRSHYFQEKIEDDLKSYFIRIQNLIDTKLDKVLHANKSMIKMKTADVSITRENTCNQMEKHREKSHRSKDEKKSGKSSSRDKNIREEIRDADMSHRQTDSRTDGKQERKHRTESKNRYREESTHHNACEKTKIEGGNKLIPTHTKRKPDNPVRGSSGKCHQQGCRDDCFNIAVAEQRNQSPSKKHAEPHCQTNEVKQQPISHSMVPSGSPKNKKQLEVEQPAVTKRERKHKPRVPEIPTEEISADPKGGYGSFRVEGIEPPNLEGGRTLRNKKSRKLECKTVSIIGITSQIKGEYAKYTAGLEEALEKKKKTKRFKLYYKYSVAGDNLHSSGDKSIVSENLRFISDHSEDNPNGDTMRNELPSVSANQNDISIEQEVLVQSKNPPVPEKLTKSAKKCTSKNLEYEVDREKHGPVFPEVQYKYFKGLPSSSSENSIESKKPRVTDKLKPPEKKPRDSCDFDYWRSEAITNEHHKPTYFLPDPLSRYDHIYKNRNYQLNLASKSDIQLSYNSLASAKSPTKISMGGDRKYSMEYPRRNDLLFDESNRSTSKRDYHFPEQRAYHQQTKISSDEYDARIEDLLNKSIFPHVPQGFDYFSKHWYPPVFFSTNICSEEIKGKPVLHKRMNYWDEIEQQIYTDTLGASEKNSKIFVDKEVFGEPCEEPCSEEINKEKPVFHKRMMNWNEIEQKIYPDTLVAAEKNRKVFVDKEVFCEPCEEPCSEEIKKKPVVHKRMMNWNEIEQKLYPDTLASADKNREIFENKEVFCETFEDEISGSKLQESDLTQKNDKFTFFSNENVFKKHKFVTSMKKDPVDNMTQKYETCDVGTAAEKSCVKESLTNEIAVEAVGEISTNIQRVNIGVTVKENEQMKVLKQPEVIAEEITKIVQPKKRVKEKSVLTKKKSDIIKPTPQKCKRQKSDIVEDATKGSMLDKEINGNDKVDVVNEKVVGADKKTKVPIRKNKNNASDLKPKTPNNTCDMKVCKPGIQNINKNCVVDETQIQSAVKNPRAESRSSKRSAGAHTTSIAKQKPRTNESRWYNSLGGKFDKFNSLKRSQSEIDFRNVNLNTEESRITSLVCMHKFLNDIKCDVSSKSNTHSLDRYFGKSANSEAHTSTFFLTKDYKTADVSAYHRRKMYDEIIRRKMRKRGKVQSRGLAPQVFEVRFLTVDNFQSRPIQDIINRDSSSIKSPLQYLDAFDKLSLFSKNSQTGRPLISDLLHTPSEECLTKKIIEKKILDLCTEMICNQNLFGSQSNFNSLGFISSCEFCKSQPNFANFVDCLRKSLAPPGSEVPTDKGYPCEIIDIYDDHSNQQVSSDSSQEVKGGALELNESEELIVNSSTLPKSIQVLAGQMSCPILKSQSSFQYLYQSESNEVINYRVKRPTYTILGYTLRSDTHLQKHHENTGNLCLESIGESSSLDESGYGSTTKNSSSCANFFKMPKIAALLRPQSDLELCATPNHLRMMKKCQEYAQKVMAHSQSKIDAREVYEEIPLDILLSKVDILNVKAFGSEPYVDMKKAQLQTYNESVLSHQETHLSPLPKVFDVGNADEKHRNEVSLIYENSKADHLKSSPCLALTPSPSIETIMSTVDSNVDEEFAQKILKSEFVISNINFSARCITLLDSSITGAEQISEQIPEDNACTSNPIKLRRMVAKKFFENLLKVYEKENVFSSALVENESFYQNHLLSLIHPDKDQRKNIEKRPKSSVGKRMVKFLARKMFKSKDSFSSCSPIVSKHTVENTQAEPIDECCRESLQFLASSARKYFSMYVQAVRVNRKINDEMKICGFQKLLENIEQGRLTFLRTSEKVDFENEMIRQVKRSFLAMYLDAAVEARKHHRELSSSDLKLLKVFVCNYRIGLLSHAELIASYVGRGYFKTEMQLRGAVLYLLKNVYVSLAEFEEYFVKNVCGRKA